MHLPRILAAILLILLLVPNSGNTQDNYVSPNLTPLQLCVLANTSDCSQSENLEKFTTGGEDLATLPSFDMPSPHHDIKFRWRWAAICSDLGPHW